MRTLVLGGGVTGLAAALLLQRRGEEVEVWEEEAIPGGWARTLPWNGGAYERGPQALRWAPGSAARRLGAWLGVEGLPIDGARLLRLGDRTVPAPPQGPGILLSPALSLPGRLRAAAGGLLRPRPRPQEDLARYGRRLLGDEAAEALLPPLSAGLCAAPPEALSAQALAAALGGGPKVPLARPAGGMGALTGAMAARVGRLRTGLRATALRPVGGRYAVEAGLEMRVVDRVLLALPAFEAAHLLAPLAAGAARELEAIPYLSVACWHSRHPRTPAASGLWGLLFDPRRSGGLLGALVQEGPGDSVQVRSLLGGAYATEPALEAWEGVEAALREALPGLGPATEAVRGRAERALPLPAPGHAGRIRRAVEALPPGVDWIGAARFGMGIANALDGLEAHLDARFPGLP